MGDGWDYGPGADSGYDWSGTVNPYESGGVSGSMLDSVSRFLGTAAQTYGSVRIADAQAKKASMYSPYGRYVEGQPMYTQGGGLVISPMLLLIGGVVLFMVMKD